MMRLLTLLIIIAAITSCKTKKDTASTDIAAVAITLENPIKLKRCFTQKQIPGEESEPSVQYIMLEVDPNESPMTLDSIQYAATIYKLLHIGKLYKADIDINATAKSAIIYYTKDGKTYTSTVTKIEAKEDMYLPSSNPEEEH